MHGQLVNWDAVAEFQSAPGREAGRCRDDLGWRSDRRRFNPRPAVRPGDAEPDIGADHRASVSIRARP